MVDALIIDACRTPRGIGKAGKGALAGIHPQQLGATVHAPAFDVMDVGRMGVVQDPQGAYFLAWEPKTHIGASLINAPGALS